MAKPSKNKILDIPLVDIDEPKGRIRMEISSDRIVELAQSIAEQGLLQPITVRITGDRYEVVYGHRRFLAHQSLEVSSIRAIVAVMTDKEAAVSRATENLAREDLTPIEEGATYKDLVEVHGLRVEQVAAKVGRSPVVVKRRMDLLRMPPALQKAVHEGKIGMSVAEELWPISSEPDLLYYLRFAIANGVTKDVARGWCKEWKDAQRRQGLTGGDSGEVFAPTEPRPHYITCDICLGPVLIQEASSVMVCGGCQKIIKDKQREA